MVSMPVVCFRIPQRIPSALLRTNRPIAAHITDIFALAAGPTTLISASGSSTLHIYDTTSPTPPLAQSLPDTHKLGCHHLAISADGRVAASAGFGGEVVVLRRNDDAREWQSDGDLSASEGGRDVWAIALSADGRFLAGTTHDGRVGVWDLVEAGRPRIRQYETAGDGAGSFGMCVALSADGRFTASGHQNGTVFVFDNDKGKLAWSLPGANKLVRAVAFSPMATRLAAAGDSGLIGLYDTRHGHHVATLSGHEAWVSSVSFSSTGEWLLSGSLDGKVKVWSVERAACVATHSETDAAVWAVCWLPKTSAQKGEMFAAAGAARSIVFYREGSGG